MTTEAIKQKSPFVTVSIAASHYLFRPERTVRRWCREKTYPQFKNVRKIGREYQIPRMDLMAFIAQSYKNEN